jgi:hypothetical protein
MAQQQDFLNPQHQAFAKDKGQERIDGKQEPNRTKSAALGAWDLSNVFLASRLVLISPRENRLVKEGFGRRRCLVGHLLAASRHGRLLGV